MKNILTTKNTIHKLEDEIKYCQDLVDVIESNEIIASYPKVKEKLNILNETLQDDIHHLQTYSDAYARAGHKTADSSFLDIKHTLL